MRREYELRYSKCLFNSFAFVFQVRGDPFPNIKWFRDSCEIFVEDDHRYQITENNGICSLKMTDLKDQDSGRYMCEAVNKIGRVSTFARLYVVWDPKILLADKNLKK